MAAGQYQNPGADFNFVPDIPLPKKYLERAQTAIFRKGEIIVSPGTVPDSLYYVKGGTVRVVQYSSTAERLVLITIPRGNFICEARFMASLPVTFQVEAKTNVILSAFSRCQVDDLITNAMDFRNSLFCSLAQKMRSFGSALLQRAYDDNTSRLLRFLRSAAVEENGQPAIAISQQELAEHLGLHRVSVNRLLRRLESAGRLRLCHKKIILLS